MEMFVASDAWKAAYPGAAAGVLVIRGVSNPQHHAQLDSRRGELEAELRARFEDKAALRSLATVQAYRTYFKQFKKTYPVQLQLESVVFKGKSIPRVAALVEAMFIAELKNALLTAGHDLDALELPVRLGVSDGTERYVRLNGQEQDLKAGDMMMADGQGIISCVVYGPDRRTSINLDTRNVLFAVYAPAGIGEQAVTQHLRDIEAYVKLVAPEAKLDLLQVVGAG